MPTFAWKTRINTLLDEYSNIACNASKITVGNHPIILTIGFIIHCIQEECSACCKINF